MPQGSTVRARWYLHMQWGHLPGRNRKIRLLSYLELLVTRSSFVRESLSLLKNVNKSSLGRKGRSLSLLLWNVSGGRDLFKRYYLGVSSYIKILQLV